MFDSALRYDIAGSVENDTYISPTGGFKIKIPRLLKPATIKDEVPKPGVLWVSFVDNACREYVVTEHPGRLDDQSMAQWADQNVVSKLVLSGASLQEERTVQTRYGPGIYLRYRHPGAGPCTVTMIREGKTAVRNTDADVGMYIIHANGNFYRLIYVLGIASPYNLAPVRRGPVDEVLVDFFAGLEISKVREKR